MSRVKAHPRKRGRSRLVSTAVLLSALFLAAWTRPAMGGMSGSMRFDYGVDNQKTTDKSTGSVSKTRDTFFDQLYDLALAEPVYPTLNISAGATLERDLGKSVTDGNPSVTSTITILSPYATATLNAAPFFLGLNYNQMRTKTGASGYPSFTMIQDSYSASLSWAPALLPPLHAVYGRFHTFDILHQQTDILSDSLSYSTFYSFQNLHISYSGSYSTVTNNLQLTTTKTLSNTILASYSDRLGPETNLGASYQFSTAHSTVGTTIQSGGSVYSTVVPYDAFSLKPDNNFAAEQMQPNPYDMSNESRPLIDGNTTNAAAGNNGVVNLGTAGNPGPNGPLAYYYHMGVEFQGSPASNALFIYINEDLGNIPNFNPDTAFSWSVYRSIDGRNWTPVSISVPGSYKIIDPLGEPAFGFEIDLPSNMSEGWLQIVVSPLFKQNVIIVPADKAGLLKNIDVTEVRTFDQSPVQQVNSQSYENTYQDMSFNFNTIVLEHPKLALSVGYTANSLGASSFNYLASTGIAFDQSFRLSRTLTGTASFFTQEYKDPAGFTQSSLNYNSGLTWAPLPTFRSSLNYSGQTFLIGGISQSNSVFIDNSAQLYKGISVYLNGGSTFPSAGSPGYLFSAGASFIPYRTMTLGMNYSENIQTGQQSFFQKNASTSISYSPFDNLFLSAGLGWSKIPTASSTVVNYNMGWSPLQGGMLQLGFGYNQSLSLNQNGKTDALTSSASLRLVPSVFLDSAYTVTKTEDNTSETNVQAFSLEFRKML